MKSGMFLDARSRRGNNRLTIFSDTTEEIMKYYQDWVKECKLSEKDVWYANIFELGSDRHLGYLVVGNDYEVRSVPVTGSKLSPYHKSIRQILDYFFKR